MLSYREAITAILQTAKPLNKVSVCLSDALNCVLAESVKAKCRFRILIMLRWMDLQFG